MSTRRIIAIVILNIILLAELCYSLYKASKDPENMTLIFLKIFFFMVIPTFIIGRFVIRRLLSKELKESGETAIPEPVAQQHVYSEALSYEKAQVKEPIRAVDFVQASKRRKLVGIAAAVFLILFMTAVLESCVARIRQPMNALHVLPGASVKINGPLEKKFKVQDLTYVSSSNLIQLSINEIYSGFWFGGTEWSGTLMISPLIEPGEYRLTVFPKEYKSQKPPLFFQIFVHQDQLSLRKSSTSIVRRYIGIAPWWVISFFFFLTGVAFLIVFNLSNKVEQLMAKEGEAEVYWMRTGIMGHEIAFGLGTKNGVKPGDRFILYNEEGRPVGTVEVQKVSETDSVGIVGPDCTVRPGYIIKLR